MSNRICINLLTALLFIGAFLTTQTSFAQDTLYVSVDEAVEIALENNRNIRVSELAIESAESGIREVTGGFLPTISVSGQYVRNVKKPVIFLGEGMGFPGSSGASTLEIGSNNSYQISATANVPIYSRQLFKAREAAMLSRNLSETDLENVQNSVAADVKRTFYTILLSQEVVDFTRQRVENAKEQLENVQRMAEQGLATEYDVLVASVQLENLYPELIQAEDDVENYKLQLKNMMGLADEGAIKLEGDLSLLELHIESKNQMLNAMLSNNYQLQLLQSQLQLAESSIELERSSLFPTLAAFGNYSYQTEDDSFDFGDYNWINTAQVGLSVQIPIFAGNANRERITQARVNLKQAQEQINIAEDELITEFTNLTNRLEQIQRRIDATESALNQAERAYNLATLRYEQGLGTQLQVNESELAYANARFNNLQALFDYQVNLITLQQLQGKILNN